MTTQAILNKLKKRIVSLLLSALILFAFVGNVSAQPASDESSVKALYILNFIKYVNWPEEKSDKTIKIGVAGKSELSDALIKMIINRKENSSIRVMKATIEDNVDFDIIIVTSTVNKSTGDWLRKCTGKGVLIISDNCKSDCGAAINLIKKDDKIRFEINNAGARLCGVKISSKLSDLAVSVKP